MKLFFLTLTLLANTALATDLVKSMQGNYATLDKDCAYDVANVRVTRQNGDRILRVTLSNSKTKAINLHSVNLENLWTRVKTTRGLQRIIRQDRLQGHSVLSEEKECMLGWVGCSEFATTEVVTLVNEETLEARLESTQTLCSYQRIP